MKHWVLCVLMCHGDLEDGVQKIEDGILKKACNCLTDAADLYDEIYELNEQKRCLLNFQFLGDELYRLLGADNYDMLKTYAFGATLDELALKKGISRSNAYRKTTALFSVCEKIFSAYGLNKDKLKAEYLPVTVIRAAYEKCKRLREKTAEQPPAEVKYCGDACPIAA